MLKGNINDLIVVGGGILGASHAMAALKKGLRVCVIEKDLLPQEATVRNFGQVVPSGMPRGEWFEYGRRALEIYGELQASADMGLRNNGSIYIASSADEMAVNEELHEYYKGIDYPSILMTKNEVLTKYPSLKESYVYGALFFPKEYSAEPEILIHRLHKFLLEKYEGYSFITNQTVVAVEENNNHCQVKTVSGEIHNSKKVIVCSGRDFKYLFPNAFAESDLEVSKLHMFATAPMKGVNLPGNILTGLTIRRYESFEACESYKNLNSELVNPEHKSWGIHILFKQRPDGSIIIGDSHEYADYQEADKLGFMINNEINQLMLTEAKRIVDFPHWQINQYWVGFYAQCKTQNIFRKKISSNVEIITGIGGKGMTTSTAFAENNIKNIF